MSFPISQLLDLKAKDFLGLVTNPLANLSFSQWGEDMVLRHIFTHTFPVRNGWYVDLGCHHPLQYSNTMLMHMLGWRGLNVDANNEYIDLFRNARPNDINLWSGVGVINEERDFYRFEIGAVSTLSLEQAQEWQSKNGWKIRDIIKIPVRTINQLLSENMPKEKMIDYLNIDIEGMDREVIRQLDLSVYRPKVVSIEIHNIDLSNLSTDPTVNYFLISGYELTAICIATFIFCDKSQR